MDILKEVIAFLTLVFMFWKYIDVRRRELKWKKTEFLFKQAEYLDNDQDVNYAVSVIDGTDPDVKIENLLKENGEIDSTTDRKYRIGLEKLCNFLDRLAYAYFTTKTIKKDEIANFQWFIKEISLHARLLEYCKNNGYNDVIKLTAELD